MSLAEYKLPSLKDKHDAEAKKLEVKEEVVEKPKVAKKVNKKK